MGFNENDNKTQQIKKKLNKQTKNKQTKKRKNSNNKKLKQKPAFIRTAHMISGQKPTHVAYVGTKQSLLVIREDSVGVMFFSWPY